MVTTATGSWAGILHINPGDLGWRTVITSWIERNTTVKGEYLRIIISFYF